VAGISLADGAGSCRYAAEGAELACARIHEYMRINFTRAAAPENLWEMRSFIARDLKFALETLATTLDCNVSEVGSTLLYAGTNSEKLVTVHLGDGCIYGICKNEVRVISAPENGRSEQFTYLTTSPGACLKIRVQVFPINEFQVVCLCSDGFPAEEHIAQISPFVTAGVADFKKINFLAAQETKSCSPVDDAAYAAMSLPPSM